MTGFMVQCYQSNAFIWNPEGYSAQTKIQVSASDSLWNPVRHSGLEKVLKRVGKTGVCVQVQVSISLINKKVNRQKTKQKGTPQTATQCWCPRERGTERLVEHSKAYIHVYIYIPFNQTEQQESGA